MSQQSETQQTLNVAVVGLNNQGIDHIEALAQSSRGRVAALCDVSEPLLEETAEQFDLGEVPRYTDLEQAVRDPQIDALAVALPHHLHPWAVDLAVEHQKHLLKEKPLARDIAEAHELARRARSAGIVLHTGVQRRHHSTYQFLRRQLSEREVRSASVEITIAVRSADEADAPPRPKTWRDDFEKAGGGVLIDLGYHGIDLLHYLLGPLQLLSCVTEVDGRPCPADEVETDSAVWAVAGPAWIHMYYGRSDTKREAVIVDTDDGRFEANRERVLKHDGDGSVDLLHEASRSWSQTLLGQLETFHEAIENGESGTNDLHEQIPTMRFIESCYASRRREGVT